MAPAQLRRIDCVERGALTIGYSDLCGDSGNVAAIGLRNAYIEKYAQNPATPPALSNNDR